MTAKPVTADDVAAVIYADRTRGMPQCRPYPELPPSSASRAMYRQIARELLSKFDVRFKGEDA